MARDRSVTLSKGASSVRKAVLLARVSSKEQAEGYSLAAQSKLLREYCRQHKIEIAHEITAVESAKHAGDRKLFRQMVDYIKANADVRTVVVEKTDRLYRNFRDYVELDPKEMELEIHLVKEGEVLSKDSRSQQTLIHSIRVAMAKNYSDNLSEEARKGMTEKAEQGQWPSAAMIGYRNTSGESSIEPHPDEASLVRQAFELMSTGRHTLDSLASELYKRGLRSRRTKRKLSKQTLRQALRNPIYHGPFVWKGARYHGTHEALISKELFDRVQDVLEGRAQPRRRKHELAFNGFITCASCGGAITGDIKKGKYVYYQCAAKCDRVEYIPEREVSTQLGLALKRIEMTPEIVEWTREALRASHADEIKFREETLGRLNARRAKVMTNRDRAYEDRLEGHIPVELWERKRDEWESELGTIDRELAALETSARSYLEEGVQLIELAQAAHSLYVSQPASEQRKLLDVVVSNCRLDGATIRYDFRKPWDLIAQMAESEEWRGGRDSNSSK